MRARMRVALAGAVVLIGPLLAGHLSVTPAAAVMQVAERPGGKPDKPNESNKKPDKKPDKKADKKADKKPKKPKDRRSPAIPALGDAGVGPGGAVSLPIIAESGSYVVVAEVGGSVVATGTGLGYYSSLAWRTTHGMHRYAVTATDRAGNRSRAAQASVQVDAVPPRLGEVRLTPGTPSDTRTRVVFRTAAGSAYRILADGRQVASGSTAEPRVERRVDLANGRHRVEVRVRDAIGNMRSTVSPVAVRIPRLEITGRVVSEPTVRTQAVRVRATPTATRGVLRIPGRELVRFAVRRGSATVEVALRDGSYSDGTVTVRDTGGRTGRTELPVVTVDTSPPVLEVDPDEDEAADGSVRAAVTTEEDAQVRWRLVDPTGEVVRSGEVDAGAGVGTVTADVDKGTYRLVVAATDPFDRTTKVRTTSQVADDPVPAWLVALLVLLALPALAALALLARWARRPDSRVRPALAAAGRAIANRARALRRLLPQKEAVGTGVAVFDSDTDGPRVPLPRSPGRAVGALPADDEVFHRTTVRLYETTEERDEGPVLGSRTAELVLARDRIALVDDRSGDVWSGRIADLAHVSDDTTLVLPAGDASWIGLVYTDRELTRSALDLVAAEQSERRLSPARTP